MAEENRLDFANELWEAVLEKFRSHLSETTTNLWFSDLRILSFEENLITLGIPSQFKFNIINEKYLDEMETHFKEVSGLPIKVNLTFTGSADTTTHEKPVPLSGSSLADYNFEYTFENFIVGSTNKFAQAACVAVANHPATNYNPLFIYGNSGLGKTHLLYATINRMRQNNPNIKVLYTKGEDFTNEMIACLANKTMEEFRQKYRHCDVLLIDDIQFIAGKIATQEEFFHTFNALFEWKKQIILTSDRPPREIKQLEDRLKTRFEWGLIADIEPPDLELRIAIIKKKAEQVNVEIPQEVLTFLAENLRSNIRQIEGAIKKLGALTFLSGETITMELARACITELLGGAEPISKTADRIFEAVEKHYGVSKEDLVGPKRNKEIAAPRHIAIFLIREITEMSFPNIAKLFNRDHATVMTSYNNMLARTQTDPLFASEMNELKKELTGN